VIRKFLTLVLLVPSLAWATCPATDAYSTVVCADNPVSYFRLGESSGTTATDVGSLANNGTYTGSPTLGATSLLASSSNTAVTLNGTTQWASAANDAAYSNLSAHSLSCDLWVKPAAVAGNCLLAAGSTSNNDFLIQHTTHVFFNVYQSDCANNHLATGAGAATLSVGGTYYIAAVYDFLTPKILTYVNGVEDKTSTSASGAAAAVGCATGGLQIGRREITASNCPTSGTIDEVACYTSVLTPARVLAHYNAGIVAQAGQVFPFSVKRAPLPQLKPWSPKEWFMTVGTVPTNRTTARDSGWDFRVSHE
jgi:hypothetical protein